MFDIEVIKYINAHTIPGCLSSDLQVGKFYILHNHCKHPHKLSMGLSSGNLPGHFVISFSGQVFIFFDAGAAALSCVSPVLQGNHPVVNEGGHWFDKCLLDKVQVLSQRNGTFKISIYSNAIFCREEELERYILHWRSVKINVQLELLTVCL